MKKVVIFRGQDRGEVLAYQLADKVANELKKRGYDTEVVTVPREYARHTRIMDGRPATIDAGEELGFKEKVVKERGEGAFGFDLHNYDIQDVEADRRNPASYRIGYTEHLELFPERGTSRPEICLDEASSRLYYVELPAAYKPMPEKVRARMLENLRKHGEAPTTYEQEVVSMEESRRMGLDSETVIKKIADLIEKTPQWENEIRTDLAATGASQQGKLKVA